MPDRIRIIPHEAVPKCGSFEVRFPDGRKSEYFYWDDIPGRRLRPDLLTSAQALQGAKTFSAQRAGQAQRRGGNRHTAMKRPISVEPKPKTWTEAEKQQLAKLVRDGAGTREISTKLGRYARSVKETARAMGLLL